MQRDGNKSPISPDHYGMSEGRRDKEREKYGVRKIERYIERDT